MPAHGPVGRHVVAFDRGGVIAVATRLPLGLARAGGWCDTALSLPVNEVKDLFTGRVYSGGETPLDDLLADYPVALLAPLTAAEEALS